MNLIFPMHRQVLMFVFLVAPVFFYAAFTGVWISNSYQHLSWFNPSKGFREPTFLATVSLIAPLCMLGAFFTYFAGLMLFSTTRVERPIGTPK
ncbi:hypothetical protein ACFP4H_08460 [Pseudophaeobacter arcticus]